VGELLKRGRLRYARRAFVTFVLLLIIFVATCGTAFPSHLYVLASAEPTIAVDPSTSVANPGEYVSVNVTVNDVVDLYSYQAQLGFDEDILRAVDAEEGPFIQEGTTSPSGTYFTYQIQSQFHGAYVVAVCVTLGRYPGVSGSGTLFTVNFIVQDGGTCDLQLYNTMLVDSTNAEIPHGATNGTFYTAVPRAQFTYEPTAYPVTGENVTFDASSSYDTDGTIVSYEWNFGDGTTGEGMVVNHSYSLEASYAVTLLVTDNDGLSDDAVETVETRAPLLAYISVPYHSQITSYYCGPAAMEMLLDFYGPDISQGEIATVARTAPDGTYTCDMLRAAHFSNLSTSGSLAGYTERKLGYAAFGYGGMTMDELKSLIDQGYPVIVLVTWHFLVAVGYSSTRFMFQDSYFGENRSMTYEVFDSTWDYSGHWALFISPWEITVSIPPNVQQGNAFNVTATITYPLPPPFQPIGQYPALLPNATVTLPDGLRLVPGETAKKAVSTGELSAGASANVTWTVQADSLGNYTISVEAEGKVGGYVPAIPSYPESYEYEDRIGGINQSTVEVISGTQSPTEKLQELIETISTWGLATGTEKRLTFNLEGTMRLLDVGREKAAVHKLLTFMKQVEILRRKKLTDEQADYLASEAERIIELIQE
jgi:hypothetical protein